MWPLFNVIQLLSVLTIIDIRTPANTTLVLTEIKNAIELNSLPKDDIKEFIVNVPFMKALLKSGGIMVMVGMPTIFLGVLLLVCLLRCAKTNLKLYNLLEKVKKIVFWGLILRMMIVTYLSMVVASGIGRLFKFDYFEKTNVLLLVYISAVIQGTGMFLYFSERNELDIKSTKD
jgi:hypothetical protein